MYQYAIIKYNILKPLCIVLYYHNDTLNPKQNGLHFPNIIFKSIFVNENVCMLIEISLIFVTEGLCNNRASLVNSLRPSDAYICVGNLTIIGSDNGLSPGRRQAIIWTNAGILLIGPLGTNFSEILIEIHIFSYKKMPLKTSSVKRRPFCLGLNVLR